MNVAHCKKYTVIDERFNVEHPGEALVAHHRLLTEQKHKQIFNRNNISGYALNFDSALPYAILRTEMPCDAEILFEYLVDDLAESLSDWNKLSTAAKVIQRISASEKIILVRSKVPFLNTRESLFYQYRHVSNDGTFIEVSTGVSHPMAPVKSGDSMRCRLFFCSKEIRPVNNNTSAYTEIWQHNLCGWLDKLFSKNVITNLLLKGMEHECKMIKKVITDLEPA